MMKYLVLAFGIFVTVQALFCNTGKSCHKTECCVHPGLPLVSGMCMRKPLKDNVCLPLAKIYSKSKDLYSGGCMCPTGTKCKLVFGRGYICAGIDKPVTTTETQEETTTEAQEETTTEAQEETTTEAQEETTTEAQEETTTEAQEETTTEAQEETTTEAQETTTEAQEETTTEAQKENSE